MIPLHITLLQTYTYNKFIEKSAGNWNISNETRVKNKGFKGHRSFYADLPYETHS